MDTNLQSHAYVVNFYILFVFTWIYTMGDPAPLSILITSHPSTGSIATCIRLSKSSRIKLSTFLSMANTNLVKIKTRLEHYSIGLAQSHMVFTMSLNSVQENPRQMFNMYSMDLKLTSSQHSLSSRAGINLVDNTPVHSSLKWTLC